MRTYLVTGGAGFIGSNYIHYMFKKYGDEITTIMWKSAPNDKAAFIDEYLMQKRFGGVLSNRKDLLTYNKIWSPGRRYFGD